MIIAGRVRLNGKVSRDPEQRVKLKHDLIEIDSQEVRAAHKVYLMLNKPRGLVTTTADEHGRATVFECLTQAALPSLSPVGRLDKASEGLLLFTNDTRWAAHVTAPDSELEKTYHVQVGQIVDESLIGRMQTGLNVEGDFLTVRRANVLRQGSRTSWLEVVLTEGKNRHIRRLLTAFGVEVLRLVRVSIGPLALGDLPKGQFRYLTEQEMRALDRSAGKSRTEA